jgi:hypothetical protein
VKARFLLFKGLFMSKNKKRNKKSGRKASRPGRGAGREKIINITEKYFKTPEDILFGFLVAFSLIFIVFCFGSEKIVYPEAVAQVRPQAPTKMEKNIGKVVSDYPIEKMIPYIARQNNKVAAFLVAIAKKESNWGVHTPKKNGKECFNYWGYRGKENTTDSGYSCFDSRAQAVNIVGKRIKNLIAQNIDTPREMLVWKCGGSCFGETARGASQWVRDVDFYYKKLQTGII